MWLTLTERCPALCCASSDHLQGGGARGGAETGNVHEGFNPTLLILILVITLLLVFLGGNIAMYYYAQSVLPPKKKKPVSKKKMMRERLKRGVAMPGE